MIWSWGWPQWAMAFFIVVGSLLVSHRHGQPKQGNISIWAHLSAIFVELIILYYGGFWDGQ